MEGSAQLEGGNLADSAGLLAKAVAEARAIGSPMVAALGSYWLALAQLALGRHDEAATAVAELSELVRTLEGQIGAVYACHARGGLARAIGDLTTARQEFQTGLDAAREIRDKLMQVRLLTSFGEVCQAEGKHGEAARVLTDAVTISEDLGPLYVLPRVRALRSLGDARAATGDAVGARAAGERATALAARMDGPASVGSAGSS
jgi:tetratricopeptide (TPR) repeat protein